MKEIIYTPNAPEAIGPYSQAVKLGNLVFTSGQIAVDPADGQIHATSIEDRQNRFAKICVQFFLLWERRSRRLSKRLAIWLI